MTASNEEVSVVVPLYNAEAYIRDTLISILEQSYQNIHIFVVDDYSTDGSKAIVEQFTKSDPRVSYHLNPKKAGCPAPTKNHGIRLAQGKYIAFCDHDDWWHRDKLTLQVAYLEAHEEVNLLGSNVEVVDTDNNSILGNYWRDPYQINLSTIRRLVLDGPVLATTSCLIARTNYLRDHQFDEQFLGCDEYDLSLHAVLDNPRQLVILPDTLSYWRWHSSSLSHSTKAAERALKDECAFAEKLLRRTDLANSEREQVNLRLTKVMRRAANAALDEGNFVLAMQLYAKASVRGDWPSKVLSRLVKRFPNFTRLAVNRKRTFSQIRPRFR